MLIEVKAKVKRLVDDRTRSKTETFLTDKEVYGEAELAVMQLLASETDVAEYSILSLKASPIKELYNVEENGAEGADTYVATLVDSFTDDKGNVKAIKYKVLLWADSIAQANQRTQAFVRQGYDLFVEGLSAKEITYINV